VDFAKGEGSAVTFPLTKKKKGRAAAGIIPALEKKKEKRGGELNLYVRLPAERLEIIVEWVEKKRCPSTIPGERGGGKRASHGIFRPEEEKGKRIQA